MGRHVQEIVVERCFIFVKIYIYNANVESSRKYVYVFSYCGVMVV